MTALGTSGGATATNTGALTSTRTFKDFHLQLKYRATATSNNGGVLLRNGEQVAILDNGTAATRSGAIVGLAPTTSAQARPVREWNTLDVIAYGDRITSLLNGVRVASGISTRAQEGTVGLENAGNNLMYADVRIKALDAGHDEADDHPHDARARARRSCRGRPTSRSMTAPTSRT